MPDCEPEKFFATSETFGGVKPLDPCNPSTERIPEELREPTGDLTPIDEPKIPDPVWVWNHAMGYSCEDKYPNDPGVYGEENLTVEDNVTREGIQLTSYGIPQRILTYIALRIDLKALARTIHDLALPLLDIYNYKGADYNDHIAAVREQVTADIKSVLLTNAGVPAESAENAAIDFVLAQERQNRIAHYQIESGLVCYWLNRKRTATCDELHGVRDIAGVVEESLVQLRTVPKESDDPKDVETVTRVKGEVADKLLETWSIMSRSDAELLADEFVDVYYDYRDSVLPELETILQRYWDSKGYSTIPVDESRKKPWADQDDYNPAVREAVTSKMTVRSEVSQEDADFIAKQMALASLNCLFVNDYQTAECYELKGYTSREQAIAAGFEIVQSDKGPSLTTERPPRLNFADVGPGVIVSYESKEAANREAKTLARSKLVCYYVNDPVNYECALSYARFYGEDPTAVPRHRADVAARAAGQEVYVGRATIVSEDSTAQANEQAVALAKPLLDCCYVSRPRVENCPEMVVMYEDDAFVIKPNPGATEVMSVAVEVGQYAQCMTTFETKIDKEASEAVQHDLDEKARNMARAALVCAYCNVDVPPTCIPQDVKTLLDTGVVIPDVDVPVDEYSTEEESKFHITLKSPTWVKWKETSDSKPMRRLLGPGTKIWAGQFYQLDLPLPKIIALADGTYDDRSGWSVDATYGLPADTYCGEICTIGDPISSCEERWQQLQGLAYTTAVTKDYVGDETCRYENKNTVFYCNEGEWDIKNTDLDPVPGNTAIARFVNSKMLHPRFKYLRKTNMDEAPEILQEIRAGHETGSVTRYRGHDFVGGVWDIPFLSQDSRKTDGWPTYPKGPKGSETYYGADNDVLDSYFTAYDSYQGLAPESSPSPGNYVLIPRGTIVMTAEMLDATKDNYTLNSDGSKNYDNPYNNRIVENAVTAAVKTMGLSMLDCFFVNHKVWAVCGAPGSPEITRTDLATSEEWVVDTPPCPVKWTAMTAGTKYDCPIPISGYSMDTHDHWEEKVVIPRGVVKSYDSLEDTYWKAKALIQSTTTCSFAFSLSVWVCAKPCYHQCTRPDWMPVSSPDNWRIGIPVFLPPIKCAGFRMSLKGPCDGMLIEVPCGIPPWPCFWKNHYIKRSCFGDWNAVEIPEGIFYSMDCWPCQEAAEMMAAALLHCDLGLCYKVREVTVECPEDYTPLHALMGDDTAGDDGPNPVVGRPLKAPEPIAVFKTELHMCGYSSENHALKSLTDLARSIYGGCVPANIDRLTKCNDEIEIDCTKKSCAVHGSGKLKDGESAKIEADMFCGYSSVKEANEVARAFGLAQLCYCSQVYSSVANDSSYRISNCVEAGYDTSESEYELDREGNVSTGAVTVIAPVEVDENGDIVDSGALQDAADMANELAYNTALAMVACSKKTYCNEAIFSEVCDRKVCEVAGGAQPKTGGLVIAAGEFCGFASQEAANLAAETYALAEGCYCNYRYTDVANDTKYEFSSCKDGGYPNDGVGYSFDRAGVVEVGAVHVSAAVPQDADGTVSPAELKSAVDKANALAERMAKDATICHKLDPYSAGGTSSGTSGDSGGTSDGSGGTAFKPSHG